MYTSTLWAVDEDIIAPRIDEAFCLLAAHGDSAREEVQQVLEQLNVEIETNYREKLTNDERSFLGNLPVTEKEFDTLFMRFTTPNL